MRNPFEVALDKTGRVVGFSPVNYPDELISPENIGERLDGGERVSIKNVEYYLTENGNLVYPDVDVIDSVSLGRGVRLDPGTVFLSGNNESGTGYRIDIADGARIKGTEIQNFVAIGNHSFIQASRIGRYTIIGSYVRVGGSTTIDSGVVIADAAKIDERSQISSGVQIGKGARLGFNTRVGKGASIGACARIGVFGGAGPRGVNQSGSLVLAGRVILPNTRIYD